MRILNCYMANDSKGHFVTAKEVREAQPPDVLCCVSCGCPLTLQRAMTDMKGVARLRRQAELDGMPAIDAKRVY